MESAPIARRPARCPCPHEDDRARLEEAYGSLFSDESRLAPAAPQTLYLPRSTEEVSAAVAACADRGVPVVISGGRTGVTGGAVALPGAALLSVARLKRGPTIRRREDLGSWTATVGAGLTIAELAQHLRGNDRRLPPLLYPVDPTELGASMGGTVATNASGANSLLHGPTRRWVQGLTVVLADGSRLRVERGEVWARGDELILEREDAGALSIPVAAIPVPQTKHTAGYHLQPGMDLVDLLIGAEGTLAVVTEVELRLIEAPLHTLGVCLFAPDETIAQQIASDVTAEPSLRAASALEYMDRGSVELLRAYRAEAGDASGVPPIPARAAAVIYVECSAADESALEEFAAALEPVLSRAGVRMDDAWAATAPYELEAMKRFRHALPERINALVSLRKRSIPSLTKIATDFAVPRATLPRMMSVYRRGLGEEGLEHFIFGHIGDGHLHVNIVPSSQEQMRRAWALYEEFARTAVALGGSVAGEHGIGRLKRSLMRIQYQEEALEAMRRAKAALDPAGLLNPGVLLPD